MLLHELAHVKRWDMGVNWWAEVVRALHWFNPLVWYACHRMRSDRELAADAAVLNVVGGDRHQAYGETLLNVLEQFPSSRRAPGLMAILENRSRLKERIEMIAQFKLKKTWPVVAGLVAIALGMTMLTE